MNQPLVDCNVQEVHPADLDTANLVAERRTLQVWASGMTDPGLVRPRNEDQFLIAQLTKALQIRQTSLPQSRVQYGDEHGYLFVVADGLGGHAGGEKASALAIDTLEHFTLSTLKWFHHLEGRESDRVLKEFQQALGQADAQVIAEAAMHPELHGMATTLTMAYCLNDELFIAHVGDSRCYLFRKNELHRLTRDHTIAEQMIQGGILDPEEARNHPYRHVVTNVVGGKEPGVRIDIQKVHLEPDDVVLLCSDGLTEMVPEAEIAGLLVVDDDPSCACKRLVDAANDHGGKDNVTVVVAWFVKPDA